LVKLDRQAFEDEIALFAVCHFGDALLGLLAERFRDQLLAQRVSLSGECGTCDGSAPSKGHEPYRYLQRSSRP